MLTILHSAKETFMYILALKVNVFMLVCEEFLRFFVQVGHYVMILGQNDLTLHLHGGGQLTTGDAEIHWQYTEFLH